jgi:uncharacterized membrane protein YphA (DoxX/SURF4 family)
MARYEAIDSVVRNRHAQQPTIASNSNMAARIRLPLALAGLQLVVGYGWLVAGTDKLLLGAFPAMLGPLLQTTIHSGAIPAPFESILQTLVMPYSVIFGTLVEWGEEITGLGLIAAGLTGLLGGPVERRLVGSPASHHIHRLRQLSVSLAPVAAVAGVLMGLSFYVIDGAPSQGIMPSVAFGGALDEGFLMALGSTILLVVPTVSWLAARRRHNAPARNAHVVRRAASEQSLARKTRMSARESKRELDSHPTRRTGASGDHESLARIVRMGLKRYRAWN